MSFLDLLKGKVSILRHLNEGYTAVVVHLDFFNFTIHIKSCSLNFNWQNIPIGQKMSRIDSSWIIEAIGIIRIVLVLHAGWRWGISWIIAVIGIAGHIIIHVVLLWWRLLMVMTTNVLLIICCSFGGRRMRNMVKLSEGNVLIMGRFLSGRN